MSDPDVQRPGYCVVSLTADLFLSDDPGINRGVVMRRGHRYSWVQPSGPVKIWMVHSEAGAAAEKAAGEVVTVPRWNGFCREWAAVKRAESKPTVPTGGWGPSGGWSQP